MYGLEAIEQQLDNFPESLPRQFVTLRPVVACPNFPTCRLSNLVDVLLKPFLIHTKSYIKSNIDFVAKCFWENE